MRPIPQPKGTYTERQLSLVRRQIELWEQNRDEVGALDDWATDGVLTAPRGVRVGAAAIPGVIDGWHTLFRDLRGDLTSLFATTDGQWVAIEWTWHVTRRSDGATSSTPDAIIVEMRNDKIVEWREYFDSFGSVEFEPANDAAT